jgi:pimeloyl-ACP methyl ester carboxylesterase
MPFAKVNDINICYEIHGEGYPVILIEGFGAKKEKWIAQVGPLSKHFKVITMDNRGSGKSDRPNYPYTMEMFADDINGLMDHLNIENAHVIGKSLGGMIVQIFTIRYPNRVKKLVLMNTSSGYPSEDGPRMYSEGRIAKYHAKLEDSVKAYLNDLSNAFSRNFRKLVQEDITRKFHRLWSAEYFIQESTIDPTTPQDIKNQGNAILGFNSLDILHKIKCKTLILGAENDRVMSVYNQKQMHERIPNSILKIIENTRHDSNLEKAPEVNQIIIDFLKK